MRSPTGKPHGDAPSRPGFGNAGLRAIESASRRFHLIHRKALRAYHDGLVRPNGTLPAGRPALPFLITPQSSGAARFVRRPCNLVEHIQAVSGPQSRFPFATFAPDPSGLGRQGDDEGWHDDIAARP